MLPRSGRVLRAPGHAVGLAAVLAPLLTVVVACGGPRLDDARLVATLRAQLERQDVRADDLTCPDLPAEVGRSVRCTFTVDGQPVDAVATVSAVNGGAVTYAVHTEARPVAQEVLERSVPRALRPGEPTGATTCSGDLPAQIGATVTCTLTGADGPTDWTVRTTSVDGGKVGYSIEQAGRA
jgi:Domain of unknown function (DUF4333)